MTTVRTCRHCKAPLTRRFLDLGCAPPSNAYLTSEMLDTPEVTFPLRLKVCERCFLVQTEDFASAATLFASDYAYFSSTSTGWLRHAENYVKMVTDRFQLSPDSLVVEVASNDGYLLRNFTTASIPCLGIEPTDSTAAVAEASGIPVLREFFSKAMGERLAAEGRQADLIIGNNVYAHVPDINDFTDGLAAALKPAGVITLEFPHLMQLIAQCQFDTVYHEHFSYLSLGTVERIFARSGLRIFDVEELPTHGGSLRVYGCHAAAAHAETSSVAGIRAAEIAASLDRPEGYNGFQAQADRVKNGLLRFLLDARLHGKTVAGYGAAAKGNTLLNYAGVKPDLLPFVCDAALSKQGRYLPGSHIPILPPSALSERRPDYVLILPWNIADEIRTQLVLLAAQGTRFVTAIPEVRIE